MCMCRPHFRYSVRLLLIWHDHTVVVMCFCVFGYVYGCPCHCLSLCLFLCLVINSKWKKQWTNTSIHKTQVYDLATKHGKRVQCNMGAKNHAVIMPDAHQEQVCMCARCACLNVCVTEENRVRGWLGGWVGAYMCVCVCTCVRARVCVRACACVPTQKDSILDVHRGSFHAQYVSLCHT